MLLERLLLLLDVELQIAKGAREADLACLRICEAAKREYQRAGEQDPQRQISSRLTLLEHRRYLYAAR